MSGSDFLSVVKVQGCSCDRSQRPKLWHFELYEHDFTMFSFLLSVVYVDTTVVTPADHC